MIRRLYVDNFRSLVDFTWEPGAETLVLGYNGSGKTTVLDAIDIIRGWAWGWERLPELLSREQLTRWSQLKFCLFELDVQTQTGLFRYQVEFEFWRRDEETSVRAESLHLGENLVFSRNGSTVTVHNGESFPVANYVLPTNQSAVMSVFASDYPELAGAFLNALSFMIVARPMPPMMESEARRPDPRASHRFENFIAWYQNWAQQQKFSRAWDGLLNEVWEDFDYLELERLGRDTTGLNAVFKHPTGPNGEFKLEFQELSEGERMLIVQYALLAYQKAQTPTTIILDEPDNFVALSEIQPWLLRFLDERPEGGQVILVSHNAEIIRTFGESNTVWFERRDHRSPTTLRYVKPDDTGLTLDERIRRGWIGEEDAEEAPHG